MKAPYFSPTNALLTLFIAALYLLGVTAPLDAAVLSTLYRLRGARPHAGDIIIVGIDEAFTQEYTFRIGELDRRFYAQAISNLALAGARVIGIDLFFPERSVAIGDVDPDEALAAAIANAPVVLPHVPLSGRQQSVRDHVPYHPLLQAVPRGVLALEPSAQFTTPRVAFSDGVLPSFALAVLERAELPSRFEGTTPRLIDYRGPAGQFPYLSFLSVYRNQFRYSAVQNAIVLLGVTLRGTDSDQIVTPFGLMSGVEVIANEVYTLRHGRLQQLPDALYVALLMGLSLLLPLVALLRRGLLYTLLAAAGIFLGAVLLFLGNLYLPPLWLTVLPMMAYTTISYQRLGSLDRRLAEQLMKLFNHTAFQPDTTTRQFARGFAPKGYVTSAEDMLESLVSGLGAHAGVLLLPDGQTSYGAVDARLLTLTQQALRRRCDCAEGNLPHYLSEPIVVDSEAVGALGLALPAPPPPHLRSLIHTSALTFGQLARYQKLRDRTLTYAGTLWPWRSESSLGKLEALAMLEDMLTTERGWLGALLESLPQAAFIMSPYGFGIYENAAARRLFQGEKNMLTALPKALSISSARFQNAYISMVEQGQGLEFGLTERASGRPVLLSLKVVTDGSDIKGVAGMVSDLSKIEELDRQRRELISLVVHDLRSPLTSIQGFSELMLENADDSNREYLQIIAQEAARMRRMTDVFLDVVRLEAEGFAPQLSACNFAEVLRFSVASVSAQAGQKQILITLDAPAFLIVQADADLLNRVVINLLSNAVKYAPEGAQVTVRLREDGDQVTLQVIDTGYGMSQAQLSRLFEKFVRGDSSQAGRVGGAGLGLYLCKLIVSAHKGTITAASTEGKGSTFTVQLPVGETESGGSEIGLSARWR